MFYSLAYPQKSILHGLHDLTSVINVGLLITIKIYSAVEHFPRKILFKCTEKNYLSWTSQIVMYLIFLQVLESWQHSASHFNFSYRQSLCGIFQSKNKSFCWSESFIKSAMKKAERTQSLTMNPKKEICIPSFFIPTPTHHRVKNTSCK